MLRSRRQRRNLNNQQPQTYNVSLYDFQTGPRVLALHQWRDVAGRRRSG
jgi:hypothetical protein